MERGGIRAWTWVHLTQRITATPIAPSLTAWLLRGPSLSELTCKETERWSLLSAYVDWYAVDCFFSHGVGLGWPIDAVASHGGQFKG